MFWRKRPKQIDHSAAESIYEQLPKLGLDAMSAHGPGLPLLADSSLTLGQVDLERDWQAIGDRAWDVLKRRRIRDIFPGKAAVEFNGYLELLRRSSPRYREEIFVGLERPDFRPILVPRYIFERHAYVLGASGSGKTSHGVAQLLIQLAEDYTDRKGDYHAPPPILIMDLKQSGDRYLRALATRLAEKRGQKLRFYSNDYDYTSLVFDPLYCLRHIKYPLKLLETLLKAFSMIYPEGYGSDFFTSEQRVQLMEILYTDRPSTMDELLNRLRETTRDKKENRDARGLYSALAALEHAMHLQTDGAPLTDEDRLDLDRFFDQGEILYVHLDSRSLSLLSRDIGKLLLFCLLETATQREKDGRKVQAFVAIDEFHRLAARNIVEMLEDARSAGLGFIIAHQSSSSLKTRDADLYGTLFENCSFKQCLTLEDERVIKLFQLISGRVSEYRKGTAVSVTKSTGKSETTQGSKSDGFTHAGIEDKLFGLLGQVYLDPRYSTTESTSQSEGRTETTSIGRARSRKEEMVCALTPEKIVEVNGNQLVSLIHVKGEDSDSITPTGGVPIILQGLYPFDESTAREMTKEPWPRKDHIDPEAYYYAIRKRRLEEAQQAKPNKSHPRGAKAKASATDLPLDEGRPNEGEERDLRQRLTQLADRLADQMLSEGMSASALARRYRLSVKQLAKYARTIGIKMNPREKPMLTPEQARTLITLLESKKDKET